MYKIRLSVLLAFLSLVLACPLAAVADSANPNPQVLPPDAMAYGKTLGEWSAAWWQWAAAIPADVNPLRDETGENCDLEQSGPVWFLAGTQFGAAERECTIPAGKAVLFPILNLLFFNCPAEAYTEEEMRATLEGMLAFFTINLECTIDGVPLEDLTIYRTQSPAFVMTLPEDNILLGNCEDLGGGPPAGDYFPVVSDGWWILHTPLSEGEHEIFFGGEVVEFGFFVEATYHITVVDEDD